MRMSTKDKRAQLGIRLGARCFRDASATVAAKIAAVGCDLECALYVTDAPYFGRSKELCDGR
jgi:hypothetical protein